MTEHPQAGASPSGNPLSLLPAAMDVVSLRARDDRELAQLRALVEQLQRQIDFLQGERDGHLAAAGEIAQLREANEHLIYATFGAQDMQAAAEATNLRQTEFMSMLAHELRNPLQPMAMANELLGRLSADQPDLSRLQAVFTRQLKQMIALVDDLFDASRIHSGKVALKRFRISLTEVLDSAAETCQPMLLKHQQSLLRGTDLPGGEKIWLDGDAGRLAQVFANLILNASKFSPDGSDIVVRARVFGERVSVFVKDNGIGVAPALQPFIFELFTQGAGSADQPRGGLGIGLALVRTLVELHGGTVQVYSEGIGKGSEFIVQLPLAQNPLAPAGTGQDAVPRPCGQRILVVEDNIDACETLCLLLEQAGHIVTACADGPAGLAALQLARYDIVLCDIGLAGFDGYEVVRRAIAAGRCGPPYFIATSGYGTPDARAGGRLSPLPGQADRLRCAGGTDCEVRAISGHCND